MSIVMSQAINKILKFSIHLGEKLEDKCVGFVKHCLGINFQMENGIIAICQKTYIGELLDGFGMTETNHIACPMDVNIHL